MREEIKDFLKMNDVEYTEEKRLAEISPVKIGGRAELIAFPNDEYALIKLVRFLRKHKIKYKILGRMSNVLPPDEYFDGIIIKTDRLNSVSINGDTISLGTGVSLPRASSIAVEAGLSGFEELSGIPGSIGGAIFGNAGAFGREVCDLIVSVSVYDFLTDTRMVIPVQELNFGYRWSFFKDRRYLILLVMLKLVKESKSTILSRVEEYRNIRRRSQPTDKPSLGSCFKRPSESISAARLIDDCGLKGYKIGGAQISEKHAGFIVNLGDASAKDYISLMDYAERRVCSRFGVRLEREVEIIN